MDKSGYLLGTLLAAMMLSGCALNPKLGFGKSDTRGNARLMLSSQSDQRMATDLIDAFDGLESYFADGVDIASNRDGIRLRVQAYFEQTGIPTTQGPPLYIVARQEQEGLGLRASYRRLQMSKNYGSLLNGSADMEPVRMVVGDEWHIELNTGATAEVSDGWVAIVPATGEQ